MHRLARLLFELLEQGPFSVDALDRRDVREACVELDLPAGIHAKQRCVDRWLLAKQLVKAALLHVALQAERFVDCPADGNLPRSAIALFELNVDDVSRFCLENVSEYVGDQNAAVWNARGPKLAVEEPSQVAVGGEAR